MRASFRDRATVVAFRWFGAAPEPLSRGLMRVAADVAWLLHGSGVRRLEANLRRARPQASDRELRRLSLGGMRSYLRYYAEAFALPRLTPEQVDARMRVVTGDDVFQECAQGRPVVLALGHQGNWDLAGAWATVHLAPVTTVAERLEPAAVFDAFVRMREAIGMRIIPLDKGADVFRSLVRVLRGGSALVPLLADRDLTASGVEVDLLGERARVAAGPAALAIATGATLIPTTLRHERLYGARRKAAGSPWGLVITFWPPVPVPEALPRAERVAAMTQGWVDVLGADIADHPTHWHMLQRVFIADLDPARYAATAAADRSRGGQDAAPRDEAKEDA